MTDLAYSRRGKGSCQCGETYSNRSKPASCSKCGANIGGKYVAKAKPSNVPAAVRITHSIYSVKSTPKGPDHRCLVELCPHASICLNENCLRARNVLAGQGGLEGFTCAHIEKCSADVPYGVRFDLRTEAIDSMPVEHEVKRELKELAQRLSTAGMPSVVRISEKSFAVASSTQLGYVHLNAIYGKSGAFTCYDGSCRKANQKRGGKTTGAATNSCIHTHCFVASLGSDWQPTVSSSPGEDLPDVVTPSRAHSIDVFRAGFRSPYCLVTLLKTGVDLDRRGPPGNDGWPNFFDVPEIECLSCGSTLGPSKKQHGAGSRAVLMTHCYPFYPVEALMKQCQSKDCNAVHLPHPIASGIPLFNVSNNVFVAVEFFVDCRMQLSEGTPLSVAVTAKLRTLLLRTPQEHRPTPKQLAYLERTIGNGYYAFEIVSPREEVSALCGLCGTCPEILIGDGNEKNCCSSRQIAPKGASITDSGSQASVPRKSPVSSDASDQMGSVRTTPRTSPQTQHTDLATRVENHLIEKAIFSKNNASFTVSTEEVTPFVNALAQGDSLINTEHRKLSTFGTDDILGDQGKLVDLIRIGSVSKRNSLQRLYDSILHGFCPCHVFTKAAGQTGGFYHLVCRHGVIYASKLLTKRESVRDAVDLYLSLKYQPILLVCDSPCGLSRHLELRDKALANHLWGDRRGCFERPTSEKPPATDIDLPYVVPLEFAECSAGLLDEDTLLPFQHPVSGRTDRFVVGDRFHTAKNPHKSPMCLFHDIDNCIQGALYKTSYAESQNHIRNLRRLRSSCAQSFETHFMYNKLMDFFHNQKVVSRLEESMMERIAEGSILRRGAYQKFSVVIS